MPTRSGTDRPVAARRFRAVLAGLACFAGLVLAGPVAAANAAPAPRPPLGGHHHKHPGVVRAVAAVSPESLQHAGTDAVTTASAVPLDASASPATRTPAARTDTREPLTARGRGPPAEPV